MSDILSEFFWEIVHCVKWLWYYHEDLGLALQYLHENDRSVHTYLYPQALGVEKKEAFLGRQSGCNHGKWFSERLSDKTT